MRQFFIFIILFFNSQLINCQKDTVYVKTIYDQIYENFINTGKQRVITQKTYNKHLKLVREVKYNDQNIIEEYIYYFYYPNDSLKQIQYYDINDNLVKYINHKYKGSKYSVYEYCITNGSVELEKHTEGKKKRNRFYEKTFSKDKEILKYCMLTYYGKNIIDKTCKFYNNDTIQEINFFYSYDKDRLDTVTKIINRINNIIDSSFCIYSFKDDQLEKIEYSDKNGVLYADNFYYYTQGNDVKRLIRTNEDGKRIKLIYYDLKKYYREIPEKEIIKD